MPFCTGQKRFPFLFLQMIHLDPVIYFASYQANNINSNLKPIYRQTCRHDPPSILKTKMDQLCQNQIDYILDKNKAVYMTDKPENHKAFEA